MTQTDILLARLQALIDAAKTAHFAPPATRKTLEDTVALIERQRAELDQLRAGVMVLVQKFAPEPTNDVGERSPNV